MRRPILIMLAATTAPAFATASAAAFSENELAVAEFWENMGPTLRDEGVEAYAIRYHENFRHWGIGAPANISDKTSVVKYWSKFHEAGHRITCTHVDPVTIDLHGDKASARLIYEQTNTYADERVTTHVFGMVAEFARFGDTWQVLETSMIDITPETDGGDDAAAQSAYEFHCPQG